MKEKLVKILDDECQDNFDEVLDEQRNYEEKLKSQFLLNKTKDIIVDVLKKKNLSILPRFDIPNDNNFLKKSKETIDQFVDKILFLP